MSIRRLMYKIYVVYTRGQRQTAPGQPMRHSFVNTCSSVWTRRTTQSIANFLSSSILVISSIVRFSCDHLHLVKRVCLLAHCCTLVNFDGKVALSAVQMYKRKRALPVQTDREFSSRIVILHICTITSFFFLSSPFFFSKEPKLTLGR